MPPRLIYGTVVGGILLVWAGATLAAVTGRLELALAGVGALAALACLMLVEQRVTNRRTARIAAQTARRVQDVATGRDLAEIKRRSDPLVAALDRVEQHEIDAARSLAGIAATGDAVEKALRDAQMSMRHEPLLLQIGSLLQLQHRFSPVAPLVSSGAWSLTPTVVLQLVDIVERRRPDLVVECGSGLSSVWLGYALKANGHGRLVALEHDPTWAGYTRQMLEQHGVADVVEVRHAPLAPVDTGAGEQPWYSADLDDLQGIELLLVDGPPARTGPAARYPALPLLRPRLADGAVIVLDDMVRQDEKDVLARWLKEDPTLSVTSRIAGGAAFVRAGDVT